MLKFLGKRAMSAAPSTIMGHPDFLSGGGAMGAILRGHDWSKSSLGAPALWSQALRTAVRLMLNTGHPMYIWWGADRACLYNDAYSLTIGPERHPGSVGRPARDVWDEIWDVIGPQIEQVMGGGGATWHENQLVPITRHGKREDVYWTYSFSPIDDETAPGGIGGVLVLCSETTQQVLSLQRSTEERQRFAALFEQAPSFMAMLRGPEHRFEMVNPSYQRLIGHRDVAGKTVIEALPEVAGQGYIELLDQVYRSGEAYTTSGMKYSMQIVPDAPLTDRFVDFVYQPIKNESGAVTGIFVDGVDVTDRAQADLTGQRLALIVESSDDAIISKNLDGVIQSWNGGAERIFGYSAAEAIGQPITMLIPDDFLDQEPQILGRIIKGERIDHFETVRLRSDGTLVDVSLTVSPVRDNTGKIVGASKVARDITEGRKAQQKQKLLLLEMNHRIKNLFAVASGVVSVSARMADTPRELASAIQSRLAALARAHDLTLQADPEIARSRVVMLADLIRTILSPYELSHGNISISGPAIECGANAATAFALLLHEFATNAVKYGALSDPAGTIAVTWAAGDPLVLVWKEGGGASAPTTEREGFGGTLVRATVAGLDGTIERDWAQSGLAITLSVPLARLKA
jgi:PAS domain S-box-containing protein